MSKILHFRSPNLKISLFVFILSLFSISYAQKSSGWCGNIHEFEFSNGNETVTIENNATYDINELPHGFYVNSLIDGYSQSLRYRVKNLDTGEIYNIIENFLPYTYPAGGNEWDLGTGTFKVTARLYFRNGGRGWICDKKSIKFTITDPPCLAEAGTLTATSSSVCSTGEVMISAQANGDAVVPADYSVLYVLTQGDGLVIQQVSATPDFTVQGGGDYTIHTLVYPNGLDLSIVELGVTTGFDVNSLLIQGGGELCASLDVAGAPIHITNPDAGTLTAISSTVTLDGGSAMISATPNGDANQPNGYSTLFVLTQGDGLVIEQVGGTPDFTVTEAGDYTIHTLVYPSDLDLSIVQLGVTTGFDVNSLLVQGGGSVCASLDVAGAPITVEHEKCTAQAGTLFTEHPLQCLYNGVATISAVIDEAPSVPSGYAQLYVLTDAFDLTILNVNTIPEFTINHSGFYRIHSLVYDPSTLDLSIVQFGVTTGFDINSLLIQGGGQICASLEIHAPVSLVVPGFFCSFFNNFFSRGEATNDVNDWASEFNSYETFEESMLNELTHTSVYPNPVRTELNIKTVVLENEIISYTIADMQGRLLKRGIISTLSDDKHQIDMNNLSSGTYIVNLNSKYRNFTTKIQVE
ncbi:MAG: hypothetical protein Wins2KO_27360 [Winogradskyella sp.]